MTSVVGGYKTLSVLQVANALAAYRTRKISLRGLRIYFAATVVVAIREAAARTRARTARSKPVRYMPAELCRLTSCPESRIRRELRALERAGLLQFSETAVTITETPLPDSYDVLEQLAGGRSSRRPVPFPRAVLRFIAHTRKAATINTLIIYCVRGLTLSRAGAISCTGAVKASMIAHITGLSLRAVRAARAELIQKGLIGADMHSKQVSLNRVGAWFSLQLSWNGGGGGSYPQGDPSISPCG